MKVEELIVVNGMVRHFGMCPGITATMNEFDREIKIKVGYHRKKDQETFIIPFERPSMRHNGNGYRFR